MKMDWIGWILHSYSYCLYEYLWPIMQLWYSSDVSIYKDNIFRPHTSKLPARNNLILVGGVRRGGWRRAGHGRAGSRRSALLGRRRQEAAGGGRRQQWLGGQGGGSRSSPALDTGHHHWHSHWQWSLWHRWWQYRPVMADTHPDQGWREIARREANSAL